jgi:dTDP-glucose pyrophosphorylase
VDNEENVIELAEKKVISNIATVGIYYYASGKNFVKYANDMIGANDMLNGEYYVAPIYNYYIKDNKKIKIYNVKEMCGLGTPEDLNQFLRKHENV